MIWRYGILGPNNDMTDHDQWITERVMKDLMPFAPVALKESIERWLVSQAHEISVYKCDDPRCTGHLIQKGGTFQRYELEM